MLVVKNAKISTGQGDGTAVANILVDGETIAEIVPEGEPYPSCDAEIDAAGLLVLPGVVDPHVHFDTPGYTDHEDFTHGSKAAAAGGVTCVIDMPDTCVPPVTDRPKLNSKLKVIESMSVIDYALWGGMSGNSFRSREWPQHVKGLKESGVVGLKSYLLSGMRTFEHLFPLELIEFMRLAREMGVLVAVHAEDRDLATKRTATYQTQGRFDPKAYYESRSDPVELDGIRQALEIAATTQCSLHIVHVASGRGAEEAIRQKKKGVDVTLETCPHYLAFSFEDLIERGSIVKTSPVVKTKEDSSKLWAHLADGGIDFLASDHAPCTEREKTTGSIWTDHAGMPGTELMFPFAFSEGFKKGRITLARLVEITSAAAAKRFGIYPRKGILAKGSDADLIFVDENRRWTVSGSELHSMGHLTPFEGMEFTGRIARTMCRGTTVYEDGRGITVEPGFGKFIRRGG